MLHCLFVAGLHSYFLLISFKSLLVVRLGQLKNENIKNNSFILSLCCDIK